MFTKQHLAAVLPSLDAADDYQAVAAGASATQLGATGAVGDYLGFLTCIVSTAATSQVQITDGNVTITVLPNNVTPGVGTYNIRIGARAKVGTTPGWKVTTGAGVAVLATGVFT